MPDLTPAQQQAGFLEALAAHLQVHPALPFVSVDYDGAFDRWLLRAYHDAPAKFTAWCRSMGITDLRVTLHEGFAECRGTTRIGTHDAALWSAVRGLQRLLVEDDSARASITPDLGLRLTVSDVEYFAAHGTLPEAGGTDG